MKLKRLFNSSVARRIPKGSPPLRRRRSSATTNEESPSGSTEPFGLELRVERLTVEVLRAGGGFKFLGFLLLIFGIVFWLRSDFWQIKRVSCDLNGNPCSERIWAELMNLTGGRNIFFLSSQKIAQQIKQNHPEFFQVGIRKQFPDGLLFEIEVRKAVVTIGGKEGEFYLTDKDGVLLEKTNNSGSLPLILLENGINQDLGTKIQDKLILATIQILYESKLRLLEPKSARIVSEKTIEVWLKGDLKILFSAQKDTREQLDSLQFILKRAKIEGDGPRHIDLRFDKPVIIN